MSTYKNPDIQSNAELVSAVDHQEVQVIITTMVRTMTNAGYIPPEEYTLRVHRPLVELVERLAKELKLLDVTKNYAAALEKIKLEAGSLEEARQLAADAIAPVIKPAYR